MSCAFPTNSGAGPGLVFRTFHDERLLLDSSVGCTTNRVKKRDSLHKVQADLKKYLDEYNPKSPFPYPDRPLSLIGLTVVALIQNDATGEIMQAIQLEAGRRVRRRC